MLESCFKTGGMCSIGDLKTIPGQIYIGRPYKSPYSEYCKYGIVPAINSFGFSSWEAIEHHGRTDLLCKICQGIQTSAAAVIDISEPSPNVHFELGILAGMSKPAILVKQVDKETPTDLQGMEIVEYSDAEELSVELKKRLTEIAATASFSKITAYPTYQSYYSDLLSMLGSTKSKVDLTHIRNEPPAEFRGTSDWFEKVIEWTNDHPMGRVRRIIAVRNNEMFEWAKQLALVEEESKHANFTVRVCDWGSDFPAVNMAIFDRERVSVALTGADASETAGFSISDKAITNYFIDYYNNIWASSMPLKKFIAQHEE